MEEECKGPASCPDARRVSCRECGHLWEPEDIDRPGKCPVCFASGYVREYCDDCPRRYLEQHSNTHAAQLLRRAVEWQNALAQECRFQVTLADIPADEYTALQILRAEQHRREERKRKDASR